MHILQHMGFQVTLVSHPNHELDGCLGRNTLLDAGCSEDVDHKVSVLIKHCAGPIAGEFLAD
jgi:hypothetical protein